MNMRLDPWFYLQFVVQFWDFALRVLRILLS